MFLYHKDLSQRAAQLLLTSLAILTSAFFACTLCVMQRHTTRGREKPPSCQRRENTQNLQTCWTRQHNACPEAPSSTLQYQSLRLREWPWPLPPPPLLSHTPPNAHIAHCTHHTYHTHHTHTAPPLSSLLPPFHHTRIKNHIHTHMHNKAAPVFEPAVMSFTGILGNKVESAATTLPVPTTC